MALSASKGVTQRVMVRLLPMTFLYFCLYFLPYLSFSAKGVCIRVAVKKSVFGIVTNDLFVCYIPCIHFVFQSVASLSSVCLCVFKLCHFPFLSHIP